MIYKLERKNPTARALILSLFDASKQKIIYVRDLGNAAALFDIDPTAIRVAITRLVKAQLLRQVARGRYTIGKQGKSIRESIRKWRHIEDRTKAWSGAWLGCYTAHLGRTNLKQVRKRERALRIKGFTDAYSGLWVRPDNLAESVQTLRDELITLGCDKKILLMQITNHDNDHAPDFRQLWPVEEIEAAQRMLIKEMASSTQSLKKMTPAQATRETFLLGEAVIRSINLDPLLPPQIINTKLRQQLLTDMLSYDRIGKEYWMCYSGL